MRRVGIAIGILALLLGRASTAELGTVTILATEEGTRLPIAGAKVILLHGADSKPRTCVSDGSGVCRFVVTEAGNYFPSASAEGYVLRSFLGGQRSVFFEVEDSPSTRTDSSLTFTFYKPAAITGQLRDTRTKQPLAGLKVTAVEAAYDEGKRRFELTRSSVTSDELGAFRLDELPPSVYFLQIEDNRPEEIISKRLPDYGEDQQPSLGYGRQYWPEIDHAATTGLHLGSGGLEDVGKVELSKTVLGRIRGRMPTAGCSEQDQLKMSIKPLLPELSLLARTIELKCGSQFTIQSLPAGNYQVEVWMEGRSLRNGQFAREDIRIQPGSDFELGLRMQTPLLVAGRLICDCQNPEHGRYKGEIRLSSIRASHFPHPDPSPVRADGTFDLWAIPEGESQLALFPLPKLYVKRVSYNGAEVGTSFALNPSAMAHSVEVVVSDKAGEVSGSVSFNGSPMAAVHVVLAPWPIRLIHGFPDYQDRETDAAGKFAFRNMAPGKYRIVSVGGRSWETLDIPDALANWIVAGEDLTLAENESRRVATEHKIP